MIKTFYKNADSATATYRALRGDYGLHNRPTTQAICIIAKKSENIASYGTLWSILFTQQLKLTIHNVADTSTFHTRWGC